MKNQINTFEHVGWCQFRKCDRLPQHIDIVAVRLMSHLSLQDPGVHNECTLTEVILKV